MLRTYPRLELQLTFYSNQVLNPHMHVPRGIAENVHFALSGMINHHLSNAQV